MPLMRGMREPRSGCSMMSSTSCGCSCRQKPMVLTFPSLRCYPRLIARARRNMKRKTSAKKPRAPRPPSEAQLKALRDSTAARRQATVERLRSAIDALTAKKKEITVQTIYEECGLRYAAIHRNQEALALFRAHSTHLVAQKKRKTRHRINTGKETPAPREPLLNYKKTQLVELFRPHQQHMKELQHQLNLAVQQMSK